MLMILLMILEGIYWFRGHRSLLGIQTWVNASAFKKQRGELLRAGLIQGFSWSLMYTETGHSSLFKTRNMLDIIQCLCKAPWPQLLSSPLSIFYPSHPLALPPHDTLNEERPAGPGQCGELREDNRAKKWRILDRRAPQLWRGKEIKREWESTKMKYKIPYGNLLYKLIKI